MKGTVFGICMGLCIAFALSCDYGDLDGIPAGFADGVDDQLAFESAGGYLGSSEFAARSDHTHPGPVAAGAGGDQSVTLDGTDQVVRSVTINCSTAGKVIVNAMASVEFLGAGNDSVQASITTGTAIEPQYLALAGDEYAAVTGFATLAALRTFTVAAGSQTFNFVAKEYDGDVKLYDSNLSALFVPD